MNPRLVAMAGPLEGRVVEIAELPFTIGRQSTNDLQVRRISVSRRQCVVDAAGGDGFVVRDLGSRHGTFVNNLPIKERRLEHGDYLRFSDSLFLFLVEPDSEPPVEAEPDDDLAGRSTAIRLPASPGLGTAGLEHEMVGESAAMRKVYEVLARVAPTDSTVLVRGESGTGKGLAAQALHASSPRSARPFVAINCATLSDTLLESELFGHVKGAFTGAVATKEGKLEVAHTGTVFLDEVGELSPRVQAKLLRALEERQIERVGSNQPITVDVRLIAATNRDLEAAIDAGAFRADLYFRLNVIALDMPPLRERREDVPLLASHFAARFSQRFKRQVMGVSPQARACLMDYDWPGNVRELANAIERAVVLGQDDLIRPEDLPEAILESRTGHGGPLTTYHEALNATKRRLIVDAFREAGGNYTHAAHRLGLHPNYLHRLIRNLGLKAELEAG